MTAQPYPPGLRIEPSFAVAPPPQPLWLPPRLKRRVIVPEVAHTQKIIYFKGRLFQKAFTSKVDTRWYGNVRVCHYNVDIDEPGADSMTVRDHIHLWITGKLERVYGGRFVHQDSDERYHTTLIEEWPLFQHNVERWARFYRREI